MSRDTRYKTVKILITGGHIRTFSEIFNHIPPSIVSRDFGTNYTRFVNLITNPSDFKLKELYTLARFFELEDDVMIELAHKQTLEHRSRRRK
jgi:hypothetical protein